jgi:hypothetical protein
MEFPACNLKPESLTRQRKSRSRRENCKGFNKEECRNKKRRIQNAITLDH